MAARESGDQTVDRFHETLLRPFLLALLYSRSSVTHFPAAKEFFVDLLL